jgi:hypothetical protein
MIVSADARESMQLRITAAGTVWRSPALGEEVLRRLAVAKRSLPRFIIAMIVSQLVAAPW